EDREQHQLLVRAQYRGTRLDQCPAARKFIEHVQPPPGDGAIVRCVARARKRRKSPAGTRLDDGCDITPVGATEAATTRHHGTHAGVRGFRRSYAKPGTGSIGTSRSGESAHSRASVRPLRGSTASGAISASGRSTKAWRSSSRGTRKWPGPSTMRSSYSTRSRSSVRSP